MRKAKFPAAVDGRTRRGGFVLPELLIAAAVFLIVVAALLSVSLFGARMIQATQPRLENDEDARRVYTRLYEEIRRAKTARVGFGGWLSFSPIAYGTPQIGNALTLYPGTSTNSYVRYWTDMNTESLYRTTNGSMPEVIAAHVSNFTVFRAMTFSGLTATEDVDRPMIEVDLQFSTIGSANAPVGPDWYFKGNRLCLRVAPREN